MRILQLPALILAAALQLAPVGRFLCLAPADPPVGFAFVFRCLAGAVALAGTYDAVSGASAAIAGVSSTSPIGPVTTNAVGKVGQPFSYRIIVTNPGKDHAQDFWNAVPLPQGLTINTNIGGNGWITGTPSVAGSYPVTLSAGNANSDIVVTLGITITIQGTDTSPPTITGPPKSQIALAGTTAVFTVTATGGTLGYQWRFNGAPLPNANAPSLMLPNVTTNQSGLYSVIVSNSFSSVPSGDAQLLVVPPLGPGPGPALQVSSAGNGLVSVGFVTTAGYRYILQSSDSLSPANWLDWTNLPPAFVDGAVTFAPTLSPPRYYRVQVSSN